MRLLPENSRAYRWFDAFDRRCGLLIFGERRWVSAILGDKQKNGTAHSGHLMAIALIDALTFERSHCFKNAGKP